MAVRSEPPRPSVVIWPSARLALETGDDDDVALLQKLVDLFRA